MVFRRRFKRRKFAPRRFRRKGFRKRRKFTKTSVSRFGTTVVPDKTILKMKYCETIERSPGTATDEYVFRGNSLFDPNFTGTGAQPLGFDQWANFYAKYRVNGSKITLMLFNTSSTNNMFVSLFPSLISTGVTFATDAISTPYSRFTYISTTSSQPKAILKNYMTTTKIYGQNTRFEDNYEAATNANPINPWYWVINAQSVNNSTVLLYQIIVIITYYCTMFERIQFDQS